MSVKIKKYILRTVAVCGLLSLLHMIFAVFVGSPFLPANIEANRDIIAVILIIPSLVFAFVVITLLFLWRNDLDSIMGQSKVLPPVELPINLDDYGEIKTLLESKLYENDFKLIDKNISYEIGEYNIFSKHAMYSSKYFMLFYFDSLNNDNVERMSQKVKYFLESNSYKGFHDTFFVCVLVCVNHHNEDLDNFLKKENFSTSRTFYYDAIICNDEKKLYLTNTKGTNFKLQLNKMRKFIIKMFER